MGSVSLVSHIQVERKTGDRDDTPVTGENIMRKIQLCLLVLTAVFATGCPNKPSPSFTNKNTFVSNVNDFLAQSQRDYDAAVDSEPKKAQRIRNDAIEMALAVVDDNYADYINHIESRRSSTDFLLDVVELSTGAAIGIAKGERPNQILGIALTAFRGGRKSSELNFYKQQTTPILISKMDGNRAQILAGILGKKTKGVDEYSLRAAIRDMVAYYNAGTLVRAFTELGKDTAVKTAASEDLVRHIRGELQVTDIPTIDKERISNAIFAARVSLAQQAEDAATAANRIIVPAQANPPTAANTAAIKAANDQRAAKLKPIRDKLVRIWTEVKAQQAFSPAIDKMKTDADYKAILDKLEANPPEPVTEDEYLILLNGLTSALQNDLEGSKQFLAIMQRVDK